MPDKYVFNKSTSARQYQDNWEVGGGIDCQGKGLRHNISSKCLPLTTSSKDQHISWVNFVCVSILFKDWSHNKMVLLDPRNVIK